MGRVGGKHKMAVVKYANKSQANDAVNRLAKSTISGNTRFIDVEIDDPAERTAKRLIYNQTKKARDKAARARKREGNEGTGAVVGRNSGAKKGVKKDNLKKKPAGKGAQSGPKSMPNMNPKQMQQMMQQMMQMMMKG